VARGPVLDPHDGLRLEALDVVEERGRLERRGRGWSEAEQPLPRVDRVLVVGAAERAIQVVQGEVGAQDPVEDGAGGGAVATAEEALVPREERQGLAPGDAQAE